MSDLGALSIGLSGLEASSQALDLIGQDIANSGTPDYVQERLSVQSAGGISNPGLTGGIARTGAGGVTVVGVQRLGDGFLQAQTLVQHSAGGFVNAQQSALAQIQQAFPEPSPNGLSAQFAKFFNAWDNLAQNPGDAATRTNVVSAGQTLADGLNSAARSIASVTATSQQQLVSTVASVNAIAGQIAGLNQSIQQATAGQQPTASLQDQRDQLVSSLADDINVRVQQNSDGTINLYTGNEALVAGVSAQQLSVSGQGPTTSLSWSSDGSALVGAGGQIGGLQSLITSTAPAITAQLDAVAGTLAGALNQAQANGVTTAGQPGAAFFAAGDGSSTVTAANIQVAITDPSQLAAASASSPQPTDGSANLDGTNAAAIGELATAQTVTIGSGSGPGPVTAYNELVTSLGSTVASVNSQATTQGAATTAADAAYANATGVNTDAEMTSMVRYQNAYSANAKFISTINHTLDSLMSMI